MVDQAYIYSYTNTKNGKFYIGSRSSYKGLAEDDFNIKYFSSSKNPEFIESMKNNELKGEILCVLNQENFPKDDLRKVILTIEDKYIKAFWKKYGKENSYNIYSNGSWNNYSVTPSLGFLGKHHTEEFKKNLAERNRGRTLSEESKKKIGEKNKINCSGAGNPMYGKHHSEEARKKISDAHKGTHLTEETKKKIGEKTKGLKKRKNKWITPSGEIIEMYIGPVKRFHKDWKIID